MGISFIRMPVVSVNEVNHLSFIHMLGIFPKHASLIFKKKHDAIVLRIAVKFALHNAVHRKGEYCIMSNTS